MRLKSSLPTHSAIRSAALGLCLLAFIPCLALRTHAQDAPPPVNAQAASAATESAASGSVAEKSKSPLLGKDVAVWELFLRGGWCMWPILGCSIIGLAYFFERGVKLRRRKHAPAGFDKDVVHAVDTRGVDSGLALCLENQSSLSRVLYAALLRYGTSRQELESAVKDESARLLYDLRRNARSIGLMSCMTPLWGLLGTVLGLIECLDTISSTGAAGKAAALASGAATALLPTAFGLLAAILLLAMYYCNKTKADDIVREISERAIDAIVTLDRKARRSIRLIEDIEESLDTQEMAAARAPSPDLDLDLDDSDRAVRSSITTPPQLPAVEGGAHKSSSPESRAVSSSGSGSPAAVRKEGTSSDLKPGKSA